MLPELKMKLNSAKAEHTDFWGTAVLTHHSAYTLIVSINMYPYVYHVKKSSARLPSEGK
jgi:hypothetical protein